MGQNSPFCPTAISVFMVDLNTPVHKFANVLAETRDSSTPLRSARNDRRVPVPGLDRQCGDPRERLLQPSGHARRVSRHDRLHYGGCQTQQRNDLHALVTARDPIMAVDQGGESSRFVEAVRKLGTGRRQGIAALQNIKKTACFHPWRDAILCVRPIVFKLRSTGCTFGHLPRYSRPVRRNRPGRRPALRAGRLDTMRIGGDRQKVMDERQG